MKNWRISSSFCPTKVRKWLSSPVFLYMMSLIKHLSMHITVGNRYWKVTCPYLPALSARAILYQCHYGSLMQETVCRWHWTVPHSLSCKVSVPLSGMNMITARVFYWRKYFIIWICQYRWLVTNWFKIGFVLLLLCQGWHNNVTLFACLCHCVGTNVPSYWPSSESYCYSCREFSLVHSWTFFEKIAGWLLLSTNS